MMSRERITSVMLDTKVDSQKSLLNAIESYSLPQNVTPASILYSHTTTIQANKFKAIRDFNVHCM
jgi:hypothetical protein